MIGDYNNLYSIVQCLPLEHVCPRLSGDFLVIVDLSLELITIPYLNQKEEIGSCRCLGNVVHHRIAYGAHSPPGYMKSSDVLICPWHDLPTNSHFHISFQRFRCCSLVCLLSMQSSLSSILKQFFIQHCLRRAFRGKKG